MEKLFTVQTIENNTNGALELMAKLAVLIVAGILFAGYGIRDGRTQSIETTQVQAPPHSTEGRVVFLRRFAGELNKPSVRPGSVAASQSDF